MEPDSGVAAAEPSRIDLSTALRRQTARRDALGAIPRLDRAVFVGPNALRRLEGVLGLHLGPQLAGEDLARLTAWLSPLYGLEGTEALHVDLSKHDFERVRVARLSQSIAGIPVRGASLVVRWSKDTGEVISLDGLLLADRGLARSALVSAETAASAHMPDRVGEVRHVQGSANPVYHLSRDGVGRLAWMLFVDQPSGAGVERYLIVVDAVLGELISKRRADQHAMDRKIYSANNTTEDMATLVCAEATVCADVAANDLKTIFGQVYAFWSGRFGRDSYDGNGATIIGSIRNSDFPNNAGYHLGDGSASDPDRYLFGVGDGIDWDPASTGSSPDFVSHEVAHGVLHATIGRHFADDDESEAINEGLADVFAAAFDWHQNGMTAGTWGIFDDIYRPMPNLEYKPYRYMANPVQDGRGSIDHYSDTPKPSDPHLYAGIVNLAFNRLAVGGGHPQGQSAGIAVPPGGVGMSDATRIFFEALESRYVPVSPTMQDLRNATALAAVDLFPGSTYERDAMHLAWDVVGVPGSPVQLSAPNTPPSPIDVVPSCIHSGWNDVAWNSPESGPATDYYELQWSQNSTFNSPMLIYSGPELSQLVIVESSSYVRVRACNSIGCSAYRGPKKVIYYVDCP